MKKIRLFNDIAIRPSRKEIHYKNETDFARGLVSNIHEKQNGQLETNCELDILYDRNFPLKVPDTFECIIVDNDKIRRKVKEMLKDTELEVIVVPLPRGNFV